VVRLERFEGAIGLGCCAPYSVLRTVSRKRIGDTEYAWRQSRGCQLSCLRMKDGPWRLLRTEVYASILRTGLLYQPSSDWEWFISSWCG